MPSNPFEKVRGALDAADCFRQRHRLIYQPRSIPCFASEPHITAMSWVVRKIELFCNFCRAMSRKIRQEWLVCLQAVPWARQVPKNQAEGSSDAESIRSRPHHDCLPDGPESCSALAPTVMRKIPDSPCSGMRRSEGLECSTA